MTPVGQSAPANRKAAGGGDASPETSFRTRSWSRRLGTPSWAPRWSCSRSSASSARRGPSAGCHSRSPDGDGEEKSTLLAGVHVHVQVQNKMLRHPLRPLGHRDATRTNVGSRSCILATVDQSTGGSALLLHENQSCDIKVPYHTLAFRSLQQQPNMIT